MQQRLSLPRWFPKFSTKWLLHAYIALMIGQLLDGLTTKIGFDFGLAEVNPYAIGVAGSFGFWGLMLWKFSIAGLLGVMMAAVYFGTRKWSLDRVDVVAKILTVGCVLAAMGQFQVDLQNLDNLQRLAQLYNTWNIVP